MLLPEDARIHLHRIHASVLLYHRLGRFVRIGVEPGYVGRGAACVPGFFIPPPIFPGDSRFVLNYLELPLIVQLEVPLVRKRLSVLTKAGYGASYMIGGKIQLIDLETGAVVSQSPAKASLNSWDHGLYGGMGFALDFAAHRVLLLAEYYNGFLHVDPSLPSQARSLNLSLGYVMNW